MRVSGIYQIQSKVKPERIYIGSACNIGQRWGNHLSKLRLNKHTPKLQNHINKYTIDDLSFTILELCFPEFLTAREQYYINELKPYFNICKIAGNCLGVKHSEKTKQKMSIASMGRIPWNKGQAGFKRSDDTRKKMSEAHKGKSSGMKGKHQSEKQREKMSKIHKGRIVSEETKRRMSESSKGQIPWIKGGYHSEETRRKISESGKGRHWKLSEETKIKMRKPKSIEYAQHIKEARIYRKSLKIA